MIGNSIQPEIKELIKTQNFSILRELLLELRPPEVADIIVDISDVNSAVVFRLLPQKTAAEVFEYLELDTQKKLLDMLATNESAEVLDKMSPDDRTALLEELPSSAATKLLGLLSSSERAIAQTLLGYPEDSIGRLMTTEFIAIEETWTVEKALEYIRKHGHDSETINVIYVIDKKGMLIDDLRIRTLLLADLNSVVSDLMKYAFVSLKADQKEETAIPIFKKYDRVALPVVDTKGALMGIVTIDDILEVAEEKSTEDMHLFGGTQILDVAYMDTSVFSMIKKRIGWLTMLFFGELLTAEALGFFEDAISKIAVLAIFIPLITSSGGNAGSQAATLVIRSIAIGELFFRDWWKVMQRELLSGLILGLCLGALGFIRAMVRSQAAPQFAGFDFLIGVVIGASLVCIVLWGTLIGSMLPFILQMLKLDPATSSGPAVATIVDVTGILIYFTFATLLLKDIL